MPLRALLVAKFLFGALPAVADALLCAFGLATFAEDLLLPSPIFGRSPLTAVHAALVFALCCGLVGGVAMPVAWFKEWRGNGEPNRWLIAGLAATLLHAAAAAAWALYVGPLLLAIAVLPPLAVGASLLRRELSLPAARLPTSS